MNGRLLLSRIGNSASHRPVAWALFWIGVAVFGFPREAHAYLDAGTGSMILQALVAGAAASMVIFRQYRAKLKAFFRRGSPEPNRDSEEHDG